MIESNQKNLSAVRKYFTEFVVLMLIAAVVKLFVMYTDMNNFIRDELYDNTVKMQTIIERNTDALNFKKQ